MTQDKPMNPDPKGWMRRKEVLALIRKHKIHHKTFWKMFGAQTCPIFADGEWGCYKHDVEQCIEWVKRGCGPSVAEWD